MKRPATGSPTITSPRALAAGFVFGLTFAMGGCAETDLDQDGDRRPVPALVAALEQDTSNAY